MVTLNTLLSDLKEEQLNEVVEQNLALRAGGKKRKKGRGSRSKSSKSSNSKSSNSSNSSSSNSNGGNCCCFYNW